MKKIAIFYGSSTGNTERTAKEMATQLSADVFDVSSQPTDQLKEYEVLIFGTSTWGAGDLQDDWEDFIAEVERVDLTGKTVAIFGYGEGQGNSDTFVGGMGIIYNAIKEKGCRIVGHVDTDSYEYDESIAIVNDKFIGLPLDEENQSELSEDRINKWLEQIKQEFA